VCVNEREGQERERERERVGGYIVDCYGNSRQEKERVDS
jgi:hypothetical protein